MTITFETFDVVIDGAPPYGFRLVQKLMDNSLVVSKLRQQGKASEAGLGEGDVLAAVNNRSCEGFNCTQALNLIDSSSLPLVLTIKRKANSKPPPLQQHAIPIRKGYVAIKQALKPVHIKTPQTLPWQIAPQPPQLKQTPIHQSSRILTNPQNPPFYPSPHTSTVSQIRLHPTSHHEATKVYVGSTRHSLTSGDEQVIVKFTEEVSRKTETPEKEETFPDVSFFGPSSIKYPTIEEQVQLARRVAQSVLAPVNVHSKGHMMFMKAKERAAKFTTGADEEDVENAFVVPNRLHDMAKKIAYVPKLPTETTNERINAMSLEEIELVKQQERKNQHTGVSPQLCFNLANDLKNSVGKGGRMFAKRQAKAKSWMVGGGEEEDEGNDVSKQKKVMDSLNTKHTIDVRTNGSKENLPQLGYGRHVEPLSEQHKDAGNRLESLIQATKSNYSAWDAAGKFGKIDRAFEHLKPVSPMSYSAQWEPPSYPQPSMFGSHGTATSMTQSINPVQFNASMAYSDV